MIQPALSKHPNGGGGRDRTDDPLLAKQVLSQLSYAPKLGQTQTTQQLQGWSPPGDFNCLVRFAAGNQNGGPGRT